MAANTRRKLLKEDGIIDSDDFNAIVKTHEKKKSKLKLSRYEHSIG